MRERLLFLMAVGLLSSCTTTETPTVRVDISKQKLTVMNGWEKVYETPIETSRVGVGLEKNSNRTPVGEFTLKKEPNHRFGPTLRLSGYQGYTRGILIHQDFVNGNGTSGCICPISYDNMLNVFNLVEDETPLIITL